MDMRKAAGLAQLLFIIKLFICYNTDILENVYDMIKKRGTSTFIFYFYVKMLYNSSSVHCVNICDDDLLNKQAERPIAKQNKVRWESQSENNGLKGKVKRVTT